MFLDFRPLLCTYMFLFYLVIGALQMFFDDDDDDDEGFQELIFTQV